MPSTHRKRYREIAMSVPTSSKVNLSTTYSWRIYLEEVLAASSKNPSNDFSCSDHVVPAHVFYQAPLAELMKCIDGNVEVEVRLRNDYSGGSENAFSSKPLYWFARVVKVAGYRLLLRFEGMDQPGDEVNDFWVHISTTEIQRVGYCCDEEEGILVPPESIVDRHTDWKDYAFRKLKGFRTLPLKWQNYREKHIVRCKFKKKDRVELLDSLVSMRVRPAIIADIIGDRVLVKLSKHDLNDNTGSETENEDPQVDGVWMEQDSPLLFYVGWSIKVGYSLLANERYVEHATKIANAIKAGSKELPLAVHDAHPDLFKLYKDNLENGNRDVSTFIDWKEGMKLEVLDPLDTWKELRVGTVLKVLEDGYLTIGFDGGDMDEDTVPLHCSSPLLFPAGYAEKYGVKLKHPSNGKFDWDTYLEQCSATAAPKELFEDPEKLEEINRFCIGAKLEAVDLCEPVLICVATVAERRGRLLRIKYDGWDNSYDQLFDFRSNNIYPLGWCEMYGHKLEAPRVEVKKKTKLKR